MAANGTNQSFLMGRTRQTYNNPLQNSRAQAYGQASSPNTPYNNGDNTMYSNQFQPTSYQPTGYSGQNPNLGRYIPPMMNPGSNGFGNQYSWMGNGGYSYNTPQAYTGGYSGFPPQTMYGGGNSPFAQFMTQMQNPFTGSPYSGQPTNAPQANNDRGMMGGMANAFGYGNYGGDVGPSVNDLAQQMAGAGRGGIPARSNRADSFGNQGIPARSDLASSFGNNRGATSPGVMNDGGNAWADFLDGQRSQAGGNQVGSAVQPSNLYRRPQPSNTGLPLWMTNFGG